MTGNLTSPKTHAHAEQYGLLLLQLLLLYKGHLTQAPVRMPCCALLSFSVRPVPCAGTKPS
jgi:hypothetical protein